MKFSSDGWKRPQRPQQFLRVLPPQRFLRDLFANGRFPKTALFQGPGDRLRYAARVFVIDDVADLMHVQASPEFHDTSPRLFFAESMALLLETVPYENSRSV
jgi:hypothetical protein